jgi:hypothetical protein
MLFRVTKKNTMRKNDADLIGIALHIRKDDINVSLKTVKTKLKKIPSPRPRCRLTLDIIENREDSITGRTVPSQIFAETSCNDNIDLIISLVNWE